MPLLTQQFRGSPEGMNLALPADEIHEGESRYIQDAFVDIPGLLRRRGPVRQAASTASLTAKAWGIVGVIDPQGNDRYAVLNGSGTFSMLSADRTTVSATTAWAGTYSTGALYPVMEAKSALNGGAFIGTASDYGYNQTQVLGLWYGANKAAYSTGTITVARAGTTVTGSGTTWTTNVVPGHWILAGGKLIGVVLKVVSNTSITLQDPSLIAVTGSAYTATPLRGIVPKVTKGTLTCSTNHAHIHGGGTKWLSQLTGGTWDIFRARDTTYVGTVTTVQSDFAATIAANATVDCADDPYIAVNTAGVWTFNANLAADPGVFTAVYAGRQWYANNSVADQKHTTRVWFSDPTDPEGLDMTTDGDWFDVYSSSPINQPIKSIISTNSALLVFKDRETWAIYGQTANTFSPKQIESDGVISSMSIQPYAGGAIWAGRQGILFFDGVSVRNLTAQKLGKFYRDIIKSFDSGLYRMWSMLARDHYVLFIEGCTSPVNVTKGASAVAPAQLTITLNLQTGAITFLTNVGIRGAAKLTGTLSPTTLYLVNDVTKGYICAADDLFDVTGVADTITCLGGAVGPDFYWETKKHDAGDGDRIKRWRWLEVNGKVTGDILHVDAVLGLNDTSTALTSTIPTASTFSVPGRVDINLDSQYCAYRFYQNSTSVTDVQLGPYEVGFKYQRVGRPG